MGISRGERIIMVVCDRCGDDCALELPLDATDEEIEQECIIEGFRPKRDKQVLPCTGRSGHYTEHYLEHICGDCEY